MYILKIPPHTVYDPLTYLKSYKKFYEKKVLWEKVLSQVGTCLSFLILLKFKDNLRVLLEKYVSGD